VNELSEWVCLFILRTCVRVCVCTCANMCAHLRERMSAWSESACTNVSLYAHGCGHVWVWMGVSIGIYLSVSITMSVCLCLSLCLSASPYICWRVLVDASQRERACVCERERVLVCYARS